MLVALVVAVLVLSVSVATLVFFADDSAGEEELLPETGSKNTVSLMTRPEVSLPEVSAPSGSGYKADEPEDPIREPLENSGDGSSEPAVSEPVVSEPAVSEPTVSESGLSESTVSDPEPSKSEPDESDVSEADSDFLPGLPDEPAEPFEEYTLRVVVTDTDGEPIPDATVYAGNSEGETDASGTFSVTMTASDLHLCVTANGYSSYDKALTLSPGFTEETVVLAVAGNIRNLLDSVELHPYRTDLPELNAGIEKVLGEILTPGMDTYDKTKACYDWVISHMVYKRVSHDRQGYWECAYQALEEGKGTCNCYSLLFIAMTRYIGLDTYYVEGVTSANGGGMTGHFWIVMEIGEDTYVFDPQVEDAIADRTASKTVTYSRFCLREPNAKYVYSGRSRATHIRNFESYLSNNGYYAN